MRKLNFIFIFAVFITVAFFWGSVLSFFPMPWPDDAAFYLTGIDLVKWPPQYRMHSQAPFVPSYDIANFNSMPLLPLLLGFGNLVGIRGIHAIRIYGMFAFGLWVILLAFWMKKKEIQFHWIGLVCLSALLSPVIRWSAMVVRPEIWQGLFWLLLLMEMDGCFKKSNWRLPLILGLSAYMHFEAYIWILPVGSALLFQGWKKTRSVLWRTFVLMTPWLTYVFLHADLFLLQMKIQFGRLSIPNPYVHNLYELFHSFFISIGLPAGYPKFFNLAKIITWSLLFFSLLRCLVFLVKEKSAAFEKKNALYWSAPIALIMSIHLWLSKPETWFVSLIHLSLWPLVVLALSIKTTNTPWKKPLACFLIVLIATEFSVLYSQYSGQYSRTSSAPSWEKYDRWISCIENKIEHKTKIWQPTALDSLVELASRNPNRHYIRFLDFESEKFQISKLFQSLDVIVRTEYLTQDGKTTYQGNRSAQKTDFICQEGPFFALITVRN